MARLWERHSEWRAMIEAVAGGIRLLSRPCAIRADGTDIQGYLEQVEFHDGELKAVGWALCGDRPLRSTRIVLANGTRWSHIEATVGVQRDDVAATLDLSNFVAPGFVLSSSEPFPLAGDIRLDLDFADGTRTSVDIGSYDLLHGGFRSGRLALQFARFYATEVVPRWPLFVRTRTREKARRKITRKLDIDQFFAPRAVPVDRREFLPGKVSFAPLPETVDIVVPVYNGVDYLAELFSRLATNTTTRHRLIVVDDASSDPRVAEFLDKLKPVNELCAEVMVIRNEANAGFVRSINQGLQAARHHVVILNTDVKVPVHWLERLMRPIFDDPRIASTTPFANRATICSFPNFCRDNDMLLGLSVDQIDRHFRALKPSTFAIELPTGLGFCMGLSRPFLDRVGGFDEHTFGRGYGEENDWCCRAIQAGGSHALVENLFVDHDNGGSFTSAEKKKLIDRNLKRLTAKHPQYFRRVSHFIARDPAAAARALMVARIAANEGSEPFEIIIDHDLGGGANKFRQDRANKHIAARRPFARIKPHRPSGQLEFVVYCGDQFQSFHFQNWRTLDAVLGTQTTGRRRKIVWVVNNLVGFDRLAEILDFLVQRKQISRDRIHMMTHDYLSVCPSYNLLNHDGHYCGVPGLSRCRTCLPENAYANARGRGASVEEWRAMWGQLLGAADRIVHFSAASRDVLLNAYPDLGGKMTVTPHRVSWAVRRQVKVFPMRPDEPVRIGVVGSIGIAKGASMVVKAARLISRQKLNAEIVVLGRLGRAVSNERLRVLGPYKTRDLPELIERERIHVFWISSIWPETYSYVTTELMRLNAPIACFDLGAPAERVSRYRLGRIIAKLDPAAAISELMALARRANDLALERHSAKQPQRQPKVEAQQRALKPAAEARPDVGSHITVAMPGTGR